MGTLLTALATECAESKECHPAKHHYDECVERVTKQIDDNGKADEDCVEECKQTEIPRKHSNNGSPLAGGAPTDGLTRSLPPRPLRHPMRRPQALRFAQVNRPARERSPTAAVYGLHVGWLPYCRSIRQFHTRYAQRRSESHSASVQLFSLRTPTCTMILDSSLSSPQQSKKSCSSSHWYKRACECDQCWPWALLMWNVAGSKSFALSNTQAYGTCDTIILHFHRTPVHIS